MTTMNFKNITLTLLTFVAFSLTACGGSSGSGGNATAASAIQFSPANPQVAPNKSIAIVPSGGTAPYTFSLSSSLYGTLAITSGAQTDFQALANLGSVTLTATDAMGLVNNVTIIITNTPLTTGPSTGTGATLTVTAAASSVAPSGTLSMTATGGTAPYTFTLVQGTGTFSPATTTTGTTTFFAPATAETAYIMVMDSLGNSTEVSLAVTTSSTTTSSAASCSGTYTFTYVTSGATYNATMYLVSNSAGQIAGYLRNGGYAPIAGTCVSGQVTFTNEYSRSTFSGTVTTNTSGMNVMTGTFTGGNSQGTWSAVQSD